MKSQRILITGALTGIGRATAFRFARDGALLLVSGRHADAGAALAGELQAAGASAAHFVKADVRHEDEVEALIGAAVREFGGLDVAVNNAGSEGMLGPITDQTADNYRATFDTNVLGTLLSLKHELRVMAPQGKGSIINLSSIAGKVGMAGASVYVASKHAVEGLTKSAALEVAAQGVRVNAVAPGPVDTAMLDRFTGGDSAAKNGLLAMMPARRSATVDEIAAAIAYLASDESAYLTGQSIAIDGGYTAQ